MVTLANFIVISSHPVTETSVLLQQALLKIPHPSADFMIREVGKKVAQRLYRMSCNPDAPNSTSFKVVLPTRDHINAVTLLAWAAATGRESALQETVVNIRQLVSQSMNSHPEVYGMCKEALEVLTVMFMLLHDTFSCYNNKEMTDFHAFIIDLLLICPEK